MRWLTHVLRRRGTIKTIILVKRKYIEGKRKGRSKKKKKRKNIIKGDMKVYMKKM